MFTGGAEKPPAPLHLSGSHMTIAIHAAWTHILNNINLICPWEYKHLRPVFPIELIQSVAAVQELHLHVVRSHVQKRPRDRYTEQRLKEKF